jgi:hypothetical protein
MPPPTMLRQPEDCRALGPFFVYVLVSGPCGRVNKQITFSSNVCESGMMFFTLLRFFVSPSS